MFEGNAVLAPLDNDRYPGDDVDVGARGAREPPYWI